MGQTKVNLKKSMYSLVANRPFAGFGHMSVYLLFAMGLGRKRSSAKDFRESL